MAELRLRHRSRMRTKDVKHLNEEFASRFGDCWEIPEDAERATALPEYDVILVGGRAVAFLLKEGEEERAMFTVRGLLKQKPTRGWVTVDMGAIRFVNNGADVMAPGIVAADPGIQPGDLVWIRDERNEQPLAVGEALTTGEEMTQADKGKSVKSIHYVGDDLWNLEA